MIERDPQLDALISAARVDQDPTDGDRRRVGASLMAAIAAGTPPSAVQADAGATTAAVGAGSAGVGAATWWVVAVLLAGGGAVITLGGGEPGQAAIDDSAAAVAKPEAVETPQPGPSVAPIPLAEVTEPAAAETYEDLAPQAVEATAPEPAVRAARRRVRPTSTTSRQPKPPVVSPLATAKATAAEAQSPTVARTSGEELSLIRAATRAITRHDGRTAMRMLDSHRNNYPSGVFALEADGLRVLALCELGQVAAGRRAQAAFLSSSPHAPLAERVRSACAPSEKALP